MDFHVPILKALPVSEIEATNRAESVRAKCECFLACTVDADRIERAKLCVVAEFCEVCEAFGTVETILRLCLSLGSRVASGIWIEIEHRSFAH